MSDQVKPEARVVEDPAAGHAERSAADRAADHAAIADSIDGLLPALIAKLGATGLAELEVREDSLRVRLRRPAVSAAGQDGRAGERGVRGDRSRGSAAAAASGHPAGLTPVGPGRQGRDGRDGPRLDEPGAVATSPAVGIYQPRAEARAGTKVRAGDRLGTVDMLGVPQEVVAPTDGLVGVSLVEAGDAVEYGQDLVMIEFAPATGSTGSAGSMPAGASAPPPPLEH